MVKKHGADVVAVALDEIMVALPLPLVGPQAIV